MTEAPRGAGRPCMTVWCPPPPLGALLLPWVFRCRGVGGGAALVESGSRVRELVREMSLELVYRATCRKKGSNQRIDTTRDLNPRTDTTPKNFPAVFKDVF